MGKELIVATSNSSVTERIVQAIQMIYQFGESL